MKPTKLRRQIAWEAARMMYDRRESEYYRAKMKAARRICRGWVKPADLPSNAEIRDELFTLSRLHEGEERNQTLLDMRLQALRFMKLLSPYRPRLIGSVLTGHIRQGSDIDLHAFANGVEGITGALESEGLVFDVERKQIRKHNETRTFIHVHVKDTYPVEVTVYPTNKAHYVFKSSVTGKAIERASIAELEQFLSEAYPQLDLSDELGRVEQQVDRFRVFESLLLPLENVKQSRKYHPEGDALYHSLQVFDLACDELPYDEEFLSAALLHDVGKAIDPGDHIEAGLEALEGFVTERTEWLIRYHMDAHAIRDGTLGARARKRLQQSESYEELLLLSRCDRAGRVAGVEAPELEEALDYLRELAHSFGA